MNKRITHVPNTELTLCSYDVSYTIESPEAEEPKEIKENEIKADRIRVKCDAEGRLETDLTGTVAVLSATPGAARSVLSTSLKKDDSIPSEFDGLNSCAVLFDYAHALCAVISGWSTVAVRELHDGEGDAPVDAESAEAKTSATTGPKVAGSAKVSDSTDFDVITSSSSSS